MLELATLNSRLRELSTKVKFRLLSEAQENAITTEENQIVAAEKISESTLNDRELLSPFLLAINNRGSLCLWTSQKTSPKAE